MELFTRLLNMIFLIQLLYNRCFALQTYTSKDGVKLSYAANFKGACRSDRDRIDILLGIPLPECVKECGLRSSCKSLVYRSTICQLYSVAENAEDIRIKGSCVEVKASDIQIIEKPSDVCMDGNRGEDDTYSGSSGQTCEPRECPNPEHPLNGKVLGNLRGIGNKIRYKCNYGYWIVNGSKSVVSQSAECLPGGVWNVTVTECEEVNVTNVAKGKSTEMSSESMSSVSKGYNGSKAVDGDTKQSFSDKSCFHTSNETNPWWRVDLGAVYGIVRVVLYNRIDHGSERASNLSLTIGTKEQNMTEVGRVLGQIDDIHFFNFTTAVKGRHVKVELLGPPKILHLCEVEVYGFGI